MRGTKRKRAIDGSVLGSYKRNLRQSKKRPAEQISFPRRVKAKGDWSLPGSNYIGPGNPVDRFPPLTPDDAVAREHDLDYTEYIEQGHNPYTSYNDADERARRRFGHGWRGHLGKAFFTAKKYAWKAGFIKHIEKSPGRIYKQRLLAPAQRARENHTLAHNTRRAREHHNISVKALTSHFAAMAGDDPMGETPPHERKGQETTPVDKGFSKFELFPRTQQVYMPYFNHAILQPFGGGVKYSAMTFRLNSIEDCLMTSANVSVAGNKDSQYAGSVDVTDATLNQPKLRAFYRDLYNYYSVLRSRVKIRGFLVSDNPYHEFTVYVYLHGARAPPATIKSDSNVSIPDHYRKHHPGMMYKRVRTGPTLVSGNGAAGLSRQQEGYQSEFSFDIDWTPGCIPGLVADDEHQQAWTLMSQTPKLMQHLTVFIQPSDRMMLSALHMGAFPTAELAKIHMTTEIGYHVECHDLNSRAQYIQPGLKIGDLVNTGSNIYDQKD